MVKKINNKINTLFTNKKNVNIKNLIKKNIEHDKIKKKTIINDLEFGNSYDDDDINDDDDNDVDDHDDDDENDDDENYNENDENNEINDDNIIDDDDNININKNNNLNEDINDNENNDDDDDDNDDDDNDEKTVNSYNENSDNEEKNYINNEETLKSKCYSKYAKQTYEDLDFDELFGEETLSSDKNIKLSKPILTKYEFVRLMTDRTKQLAQGAKPMLKNITDLSSKEIAKLEIKNKIIPLIIERPIPNSKSEFYKLKELEIPEYLFS